VGSRKGSAILVNELLRLILLTPGIIEQLMAEVVLSRHLLTNPGSPGIQPDGRIRHWVFCAPRLGK